MSIVAADRRRLRALEYATRELNSDAAGAILRNSSLLAVWSLWRTCALRSVMVYGGGLCGTDTGMELVLLCTAAWTGGAGCEGQLACSLA